MVSPQRRPPAEESQQQLAELEAFKQAHFAPLVDGGLEPIDGHAKSTAILYEATSVLTAIKNNIVRNFYRHVCRYADAWMQATRYDDDDNRRLRGM